jgi:spore coat polysaccharide biosynthesis predicted glycosyltransferase SpsG
MLAERGIDVVAAPEDPDGLADLAVREGLGAVVIDGYHLAPGTGTALRAHGIRVLSIVDGGWGAGQDADVYLDQNLGATAPLGPRRDAVHLAGLDYALFRDDVLAHRTETDRRPTPGRPRLLALFGGTDPYGAAPVVVPLALATGVPVEVVAVAANPEIAAALEALPTGPDQAVTVLPSAPSLGEVAASCDAAVSAAGSSTWELLCLGVPTALVSVVANQEVGYVATVAEGVVDPAGRLAALREDPDERDRVVGVLRRLLTDAGHRAALRQRGMGLVDGHGRTRVADALLAD